jgi:ribonuclease P protein component
MLRLITKHSEYGEFLSSRQYLRSEHFYAAVLPSAGEFALGITISKRIGKAHLRNLLKRRIKAWLHLQRKSLAPGSKLNLVARPGAAQLAWEQLSQELQGLLSRL